MCLLYLLDACSKRREASSKQRSTWLIAILSENEASTLIVMTIQAVLLSVARRLMSAWSDAVSSALGAVSERPMR